MELGFGLFRSFELISNKSIFLSVSVVIIGTLNYDELCAIKLWEALQLSFVNSISHCIHCIPYCCISVITN